MNGSRNRDRVNLQRRGTGISGERQKLMKTGKENRRIIGLPSLEAVLGLGTKVPSNTTSLFPYPLKSDLNWTNPDMRRATYSDMEFLLDKGVDGYRIGSMNLMSKHPDLPDAPVTNPNSEFQSGALYFASGPRMHEYVKEMRQEVFGKYDCMTVGELGFTKDEHSVSEYVAKDRHELNTVFAGDIVDMDFGTEGKYGHNDFQLS
jgi:glycosidase